jgi:hypothetical protein
MFLKTVLEFSKSKETTPNCSQRLIINNKQELAIEEIKFEKPKN